MKKHLLYLFNFFWLSLASSLLYYLLLQNNPFHLSIAEILDFATHCTKHGHLLVIGFLPIYLGIIIFGAALLFTYLRSSAWPRLSHSLKQWFHIGR